MVRSTFIFWLLTSMVRFYGSIATFTIPSGRTFSTSRTLISLFMLLLGASPLALVAQSSPDDVVRPKLVVGIVVDQMRQEYLYRYASKFGRNGFKRLMRDGFVLKNAHYNYIPTYTGPGHASIYTGATPASHGIVANRWYDRALNKMVNCVGDNRYAIVGGSGGANGRSPSRMLATTITDELKLATQRRAKVVGLSFKDRGAILPAGHLPDGAYWYDYKTGQFVTSSYYAETLPRWLQRFNALKLSEQYLNMTWTPVYPLEQYWGSGPDDVPYEMPGVGTGFFFPHRLRALRKAGEAFAALPLTPFGNDLLTQLAFAAIEGEHMGEDSETDFLTLSYSSTDILGHAVGPNAVELEDMYIRLDNNLSQLFDRLDRICSGEYLVFLTADHGVAAVERYALDLKLISFAYKRIKWKDSLAHYLSRSHLPANAVVKSVSNGQVYIAPVKEKYFAATEEYVALLERIRGYMMRQPGVADVFTRPELRMSDFGERSIRGMVKRGFHRQRSGDIAFVMNQGITAVTPPTATTHGTGYTYDTHVPVLFYGWGIEPGSTATYHPITDITPTLSVLLKIKIPSNSMGNPLSELWDKD